MLFKSTHKREPLSAVLTDKPQLLVVVLMLVKGSLCVKSFTAIQTKLYVMMTVMMFIQFFYVAK